MSWYERVRLSIVLASAKRSAELAEGHAAWARVREANRAGYEIAQAAGVGFDTATAARFEPGVDRSS